MIFIIIIVGLIFQPMAANSGVEEVAIELLSLLAPNTLSIENEESKPVAITLHDKQDRNILLHAGEILKIDRGVNRLNVSIDNTDVSFNSSCESIFVSRGLLRLVVPGFEQHARRIQSSIRITPGARYLKIIAHLPIEQAVAEITAAEMGGRLVPQGAINAQAICVRSYLLFYCWTHPRQSLSDTTADMLYRGLDGAFGPDGSLSIEQGRRAARETESIVLSNNGHLYPAFFHACCGGITRTVTSVFGKASAHLPYDGDSVECGYCNVSPYRSWKWHIDAGEFSTAVFEVEDGSLNVVKDASLIRVNNTSSAMSFSVDEFRLRVGRVFGWDALKSNVFEVTREENQFVFSGKGAGHNVGFCQAGAIEAARRGMTWMDLLELYFPSCKPQNLKHVDLYKIQ